MSSEVGDTVPSSQTAKDAIPWQPLDDFRPVYPLSAWQDPPKYLCRKCNKTFDFPEYVLYDTTYDGKRGQSSLPHCPHCHKKWEQ